jgi:hypothetical protein
MSKARTASGLSPEEWGGLERWGLIVDGDRAAAAELYREAVAEVRAEQEAERLEMIAEFDREDAGAQR